MHIVSPEATSLDDRELLQSLNQIYCWQEKTGPYETNLIEQCEKACAVPIEEIKLADLNTLIMQGIGLKTLLQIALPIVELAPWIETEYYSGDLLVSIIHVADKASEIESKNIERMGGPARKLLAILREEKRFHDNHPEIWKDDYWADDIIKDLEQFLSTWSLNAN